MTALLIAQALCWNTSGTRLAKRIRRTGSSAAPISTSWFSGFLVATSTILPLSVITSVSPGLP